MKNKITDKGSELFIQSDKDAGVFYMNTRKYYHDRTKNDFSLVAEVRANNTPGLSHLMYLKGN